MHFILHIWVLYKLYEQSTQYFHTILSIYIYIKVIICYYVWTLLHMLLYILIIYVSEDQNSLNFKDSHRFNEHGFCLNIYDGLEAFILFCWNIITAVKRTSVNAVMEKICFRVINSINFNDCESKKNIFLAITFIDFFHINFNFLLSSE